MYYGYNDFLSARTCSKRFKKKNILNNNNYCMYLYEYEVYVFAKNMIGKKKSNYYFLMMFLFYIIE